MHKYPSYPSTLHSMIKTLPGNLIYVSLLLMIFQEITFISLFYFTQIKKSCLTWKCSKQFLNIIKKGDRLSVHHPFLFYTSHSSSVLIV